MLTRSLAVQTLCRALRQQTSPAGSLQSCIAAEGRRTACEAGVAQPGLAYQVFRAFVQPALAETDDVSAALPAVPALPLESRPFLPNSRHGRCNASEAKLSSDALPALTSLHKAHVSVTMLSSAADVLE